MAAAATTIPIPTAIESRKDSFITGHGSTRATESRTLRVPLVAAGRGAAPAPWPAGAGPAGRWAVVRVSACPSGTYRGADAVPPAVAGPALTGTAALLFTGAVSSGRGTTGESSTPLAAAKRWARLVRMAARSAPAGEPSSGRSCPGVVLVMPVLRPQPPSPRPRRPQGTTLRHHQSPRPVRHCVQRR